MFTLAAARAEGLTILDGVWNDIADVEDGIVLAAGDDAVDAR